MGLFFIDLQIDRCGACTIRCFADLMAPRIRRVALIYDARLVYDLKVMMGVASYIRERPQFSVYIEENALKDQRLPDLRSWQGDGIIADFDDPAIARLVRNKLDCRLWVSAAGTAGTRSDRRFRTSTRTTELLRCSRPTICSSAVSTALVTVATLVHQSTAGQRSGNSPS